MKTRRWQKIFIRSCTEVKTQIISNVAIYIFNYIYLIYSMCHQAHVQLCESLANQDAANEHMVSCSGLAGQPGCSIPPCDSSMSTWSPCRWMCEPHTCGVSSKLGMHETCALNTSQASEPILNIYLLTSPYSRIPG